MKLQEIKDIASIFNIHKKISYVARFNNNLINFRLDNTNYFVNLEKSNPHIFISNDILRSKIYNAPFDNFLSKYFYKSDILSCRIDGLNKILEINISYKNNYKSINSVIFIELINYISNFIIVVDDKIIQALHYNERVSINKKYEKLPQPSFTKVLENNENFDEIKKSLEKNYEILRDRLVENTRKSILDSLYLKKKKLEDILSSLPQIDMLKKQYLDNFNAANYILGNLSNISNYADSILLNGENFIIPIASKPQFSADKLFKKSKKIKQKIDNLYLQKDNIDSKILFLENKINYCKIASLQDLKILKQKRRLKFKEVKKQYESFFIDGVKISMGKNESENIKLLQDSRGDDIWLHIQNIPSSHMIIHTKKVEKYILESAARLLVKLNGIKDRVVVDYVKRKFVKIISGANVVYSKHSSLVVRE